MADSKNGSSSHKQLGYLRCPACLRDRVPWVSSLFSVRCLDCGVLLERNAVGLFSVGIGFVLLFLLGQLGFNYIPSPWWIVALVVPFLFLRAFIPPLRLNRSDPETQLRLRMVALKKKGEGD